MWSRWNRGDFAPKTHGLVQNLHMLGWLCEIRTCMGCCVKFAHAWAAVRNSHMHGWLCEIRTCMVQLSFKGHIFLISAQNHTRFEALDSWLPEIWNGISNVENGLRKVLQKCKGRLQLLSFIFFTLFSSLLLSFTWLVLMIQKAVKTLKLATNMIRSHW